MLHNTSIYSEFLNNNKKHCNSREKVLLTYLRNATKTSGFEFLGFTAVGTNFPQSKFLTLKGAVAFISIRSIFTPKTVMQHFFSTS